MDLSYIVRQCIQSLLYLSILLWTTGCLASSEIGVIGWINHEPSPRALPGTVAAAPALRSATTAAEADSLDPAQLRLVGAQLYATHCAPCHRLNGEGNLGRFPALNHNALVTGRTPAPLITRVLQGYREMPGFAPSLNDAELAAVLTYVRQAWSNQAAPIDPAQVQSVRERISSATTQ
jgi:mono/diheme cytochrome c family protein